MKKLIITLIAAFFCIAIYSQSATVLQREYTAQTINGATSDTFEFNRIEGEYDVSLQLIPALAGSGDSLEFAYVLYQSDHASDNAWTAITTSATVSSARDADALVSITDFNGLRLRVIMTGVAVDTFTVTPYSIYKKHKNE